MTTTYRVRARRWDKGWELHIDGVGATQARRPAEFREMARDLIARRTGLPVEAIRLTWVLGSVASTLLPDEMLLLESVATTPGALTDALDGLLPPWPKSSSHGARRRWRNRWSELFRAWQVLMADGLVRVVGTTADGRHYLYEATDAGWEALGDVRNAYLPDGTTMRKGQA